MSLNVSRMGSMQQRPDRDTQLIYPGALLILMLNPVTSFWPGKRDQLTTLLSAIEPDN